MTWFDVKMATLQHMFSVKGETMPSDTNTNIYKNFMPYAANEGLRLILSVKPSAWRAPVDDEGNEVDSDAFNFAPGTTDDVIIPLSPDCAVLLPLYMASQLYKEDDRGLATMWRNEFEAALERAAQSRAKAAHVEVWDYGTI